MIREGHENARALRAVADISRRRGVSEGREADARSFARVTKSRKRARASAVVDISISRKA